MSIIFKNTLFAMSFFEVDFIIVLMKKEQSVHKTEPDTWLKANDLNKELSNWICIWVDSKWSGISCFRIGYESDKFALFRVKGKIEKIDSSKLYFIDDTNTKKICDSIKVHFFQKKKEKNEMREDFLYSSAFPIQSLITKGFFRKTIGLFNYNAKENQCDILDNMRLVIYNLLPISQTILQITERVNGPDKAHHQRCLDISEWISNYLENMCMGGKTKFLNPRTYMRNYCNSTLFQMLPAMYHTHSTNLPPVLACYALCNSLIVNQVPLENFVADFFTMDGLTRPSENALILLRILRDVVACWTMCQKEGIYWADMSLGQSVEDQPFPLSFMTQDRVFKKGDCEDRVSQAEQMVGLLLRMLADVEQHHDLVQYIASRPVTSQILAVSHATLCLLVSGCCKIARLIQLGIIEIQRVVGDVNFASFSSSESEDDNTNAKELSGHSFGILRYDDGNYQDCIVLEATGWERRILDSDIPITQTEKNIRNILLQILPNKVNMCRQLSKNKEYSTYQNIFLGDDCIYFTYSQNDKGQNVVEYGAKLGSIAKDSSFTRKTCVIICIRNILLLSG